MVSKDRLIRVFLILFMLLVPLNALSETGQGYKILLKNGKTIETDWYEVTGNWLKYEKFGVDIKIENKTVSKIEKKSAPVRDPDIDIVEYQEPIAIPVYYQVTGVQSDRNRYNVLYEQDGENDGFPMYKAISRSDSIFFNMKYRKMKNGCWAIGAVSYNSAHYVSIFENAEIINGHPVFNSGWKSSGSLELIPSIKVRKSDPPATIYAGRFKLIAKGFPNQDCNGVYKPFGIYKGRVKYRNDSGDAVLRIKWGAEWVIEYKKRANYLGTSDSVANPLAHETTYWKDVNKRTLNASIKKHSPVVRGS